MHIKYYFFIKNKGKNLILYAKCSKEVGSFRFFTFVIFDILYCQFLSLKNRSDLIFLLVKLSSNLQLYYYIQKELFTYRC